MVILEYYSPETFFQVNDVYCVGKHHISVSFILTRLRICDICTWQMVTGPISPCGDFCSLRQFCTWKKVSEPWKVTWLLWQKRMSFFRVQLAKNLLVVLLESLEGGNILSRTVYITSTRKKTSKKLSFSSSQKCGPSRLGISMSPLSPFSPYVSKSHEFGETENPPGDSVDPKTDSKQTGESPKRNSPSGRYLRGLVS